MLRSVYAKTVWERRSSMWWWGGGLLALLAATVAFYPSLRGQDTFEELFESMPRGLLSLFGVEEAADLLSSFGFINSRMFASIGPIVLIIFAISRATTAIAGQEEERTMDLLLAQPISRDRVVLEQFMAVVTLTFVLAGAIFVGLVISNPIVDLEFSLLGMAAACTGLALLSLLFGALALAVGGVTGKRGLTFGVSAGVAVAAFFIQGLAPLVEGLEAAQKGSPFYWFLNPRPLQDGFDIGSILLTVAVTGVLVGVTLWGFRRRDVSV